jgi:arylsulfatase A-like enzyme
VVLYNLVGFMKYLLHFALLFALIAGLMVGISRAVKPRRPNVILISIDTLRADHLSCYGYRRPTPHIESLARDGVLFEMAMSQAPWTTASHMSVFTSLYPTVHRVTHSALSEVQSTLVQVFHDGGYQTAAFVEATALDRRYGFDRGFDVYRGKSDDPSAGSNNERVMDWVTHRDRSRPFFLFTHYYDVHRKYNPPPPYNSVYRGQEAEVEHLIVGPYGRRRGLTAQQLYDIMALYDGEIRYVDDQINNLMQFLKQNHLYEDSFIVLMADHGEGFLDHSLMDHGNSLYQELMHVPLILKLPHSRLAGTHREQTVRLIDILPTVLDYAGLKSTAMIQGASLIPLLFGTRGEIPPVYSTGAVGSEAITAGQWKLIHNADLLKRLEMVPLALPVDYELYDLNLDPGEMNNLAAVNREQMKMLNGLLQSQTALNDLLASRIHTEHKPLNQEMEEELKSLGYLQ